MLVTLSGLESGELPKAVFTLASWIVIPQARARLWVNSLAVLMVPSSRKMGPYSSHIDRRIFGFDLLIVKPVCLVALRRLMFWQAKHSKCIAKAHGLNLQPSVLLQDCSLEAGGLFHNVTGNHPREQRGRMGSCLILPGQPSTLGAPLKGRVFLYRKELPVPVANTQTKAS